MGYWTDIIIRVNGNENDAKVINEIMTSDTYREKIEKTADGYEKEVNGGNRFGNSWSEKNEILSTYVLNKQRFPFIYKDLSIVRDLETGEKEYWFVGRIKDEFSLSYYLALHELLKEGDYDFNGKVTWYWLGEQVDYVSDQAEVGFCEITKERIDFFFPYLEEGSLVDDENVHLIRLADYQDPVWASLAEGFGINDRCKDILEDVNDFNIRHDDKTSDTLMQEVQNYTQTAVKCYGHECPQLLFFAQVLMGPFTIIQNSIAKTGEALNGFYDYEDLIKAGWYTDTKGKPFFE